MKHIKKLFIGSIVLYSLLGGCQNVQYVPVTTQNIYCPEPTKPSLPLLQEQYYLEHAVNIEILMRRDDMMRLYIDGLEDTINCYKNSFKGKK